MSDTQKKAPARASNTEPGENQEQPQDATTAAEGKPINLDALGGIPKSPQITIEGKQGVALPNNDRTIGEFADELGALLAPGEIFSRGQAVCVPNRNSQKLSNLSPEAFRSWIETMVVPISISRESNGRERFTKKSPSADVARATLASPQFLRHLRSIRSFSSVQMPVIRATGELEILRAGFDSVSGIYTDPHGPVWRIDFNADRAIEILDRLLVDFPFVDARSKSVAIAAMLTVFGQFLLEKGALTPCFFFDSNSEGSGKTTLAGLAALPYGTPRPQSLPKNEAEIEKRLVALVRSGRRVEIFDNLKGHINSPSLEGYLSAADWAGRLLGKSEEIAGEAGAVILLTGNGCTFTPDLRRRSLTCNLFVQELLAEERTFSQPLDVPAMLKIRGPIMSCLWTLIRNWNDTGRPSGTGHNASFQPWANIIGGIVEHAGYPSPVAPSNAGTGGDTDTKDMQQLAAKLEPFRNYAFASIVEICREIGAFERLDCSSDDDGIARKGKSSLSKIFKRFEGKMLLPGLCLRILGSGHSRRYALTESA